MAHARVHPAWMVAAVVGTLLACSSAKGLQLDRVDRKINLKQPIVKVADVVKVKNTDKGAVDSVVLCYLESLADRLANLKVTVEKQRLAVEAAAPQPAGTPAGVTCYTIQLATPLQPGGAVTLDTLATFTNVHKPNPAQIRQGELQLVEYTDSLRVVSPYTIEKQSVEVLFPNTNIKSFTPDATATKKDARINYGPFSAAAPWSIQPLKLHFEQDKPYKQVVSLVREIEVSHWGNIYVEESYLVRNAGANHTGSFSRLRFAHDLNGKGNSWQGLRARLPAPATSLYYKDLIGNVSSSDTRHSSKETALDLSLRYPLMGGWKVDFVLGYSLPLPGFLFKRPNGQLRLIVDFGAPFDDVWVEDLEVRVVLPEGARDISWTVPFPVAQSWDKKFTYLDTIGRPVLVLRKANALPAHNVPFAVDYSFSSAALWREPLLLVAVFALLFAAFSLFNRCEFTITKDEAWQQKQERDRAAGVLAQLLALLDEQQVFVERLSHLAATISSSADADSAEAERTRIEASLKELDAKVKAAFVSLEGSGGSLVGNARELVERGGVMRTRANRLLSDKLEALKKGSSAADATKKVAAAFKQLVDARLEFATMSEALLQG